MKSFLTKWPLWLILALAAAAFAVVMLGCLTGNKGVDTSKPQDVEADTTIRGDRNRVTNVVLQVGQIAPWAACGLFGVATWRGRRYRQGLDRAIEGIEMCGPKCTAKDHMRSNHDAIERIVHRRVKTVTGPSSRI